MTQAKFYKNIITLGRTLPPKTVIFLTSLIFIALAAFYLHRIQEPGTLVWDEQHHVPAAFSYLQGDKSHYSDLRNPPLGKELIALSMKVFGDNFFAYRLPAALSAASIGALLFFVGTWLADSWEAGLLSVIFWCSSTLAFLHARLAMLDMPTALFFFAGLAAFLPLLRDPNRRHRDYFIHLGCLLAAIGGMIKAVDYLLFPLFFAGLCAVRGQWQLRQSLPRLFGFSLFWFLSILFLGYGLIGYSPAEIPHQWNLMFRLQTSLHQDYPGLSLWYQWFLGKGELWYRSRPLPEGGFYTELCKQNPVLWILGGLANAAAAIQWIRRRDPIDLLLALAVPAQALFWFLFKEQQILTYALPMEPIYCLSIPYFLGRWLKNPGYFRIWGLCLATASLFFLWKSYSLVLGFQAP